MRFKIVQRLALLSATVLGLAACDTNCLRVIFVDKDPAADSAVCTWTKGATVVICTRFSAAGTRKDTSGLSQ